MTRRGTGGRPRRAKDDAKDAVLDARCTEAFQLRVNGHSYREIAKLMGVGVASAKRYSDHAAGEIPAEEREAIRRVENARLDGDHETLGRMLRKFVKLAEAEAVVDELAETPQQRADRLAAGREAAVEAARVAATLIEKRTAISARRGKINGLDVDRVETTGRDGGPIELAGAHDDLLGRLARLAAAGETPGGDSKPDGGGSGTA